MKKLAAIAILPLVLAAFMPQQDDSNSGSAGALKRRYVATYDEQIRAQLFHNRCWTDHSDMPEAPRLRATFQFAIGPDGHFVGRPSLIEPSAEPSEDAQMKKFVGYARRALDVCNALGWEMSPDYYFLRPDLSVITLKLAARFP